MDAHGWHQRYIQQARWTEALRTYLLQRAGYSPGKQLLEVGCGTGAVLGCMGAAWGLDINLEVLRLARVHCPSAVLVEGDAHHLPFRSTIFDLVLSHFLLLWVKDPLRVIQEMARVTVSGGAVLAMAEPDYGGRIDFPFELGELGRYQRESLEEQGANIHMGRQLRSLFIQAGLSGVESGLLSGQWTTSPSLQDLEMEWQVLESDLAGKISQAELERFKQIDSVAWKEKVRVLFVPTFYAWGRV